MGGGGGSGEGELGGQETCGLGRSPYRLPLGPALGESGALPRAEVEPRGLSAVLSCYSILLPLRLLPFLLAASSLLLCTGGQVPRPQRPLWQSP